LNSVWGLINGFSNVDAVCAPNSCAAVTSMVAERLSSFSPPRASASARRTSPVAQKALTLADTEADGLHHRIAAEAATKEEVRGNLDSLVRGLDVSLKRLKAACSEVFADEQHWTSADADSLCRHVTSCCSEIQDRLHDSKSSPQASTSARTYDVLRQSLTSAQRRCAALNEDMLRVADGNEELMSSFQVVKDTNRRLVDQIQAQNDEIDRLTQIRLDDEVKFEEFVTGLKTDQQNQQLEYTQRLRDCVEQCQASFHQEQAMHLKKLEVSRKGLRSLAVQLAGLRELQSTASSSIRAELSQWKEEAVKQMGRRIMERLSTHQQDDSAQLLQLEDAAHAFQARIAVERESGISEMEAWSSKGLELDAESRSLAQKASDQTARLARELATAETSRHEGLRSLAEEQRRAADRLQEIAAGAASLSVCLDDSTAQALGLEARGRVLKDERQHVEEEYKSASRQLQEADEALDKAVACNEGLRQQIEAERVEAQQSCDAALKECNGAFKVELAELLLVQRQEVDQLEAKLMSMEKDLAEKSAQAVSLAFQESQHEADVAMLERESALWKAQQELASGLLQEVDDEFQQVRQTWAEELREMKCQEADLLGKESALEAELACAMSSTSEAEQDSSQLVAALERKASVVDSQIREVEMLLIPVRQSLQRKVYAVSSVRDEAGEQRASTMESQDSLQKKLAALAKEAAQSRARLEAEISSERSRLHLAQSEIEALRKQSVVDVKSVDAGGIKVSISHAKQDLEAELEAADAAEAEVREAQRLLDEQERLLQEETSKLRSMRSEVASTRRRLEMDPGHEVSDSKLNAVYRQHQQILAATRERMQIELDRQRHAIQIAEDENRRLKQAASTSARSGVEDSLNRMKSRTEQLRRDLQLRHDSGKLARVALAYTT